jgi:methylenetetrahydrofolate reductase (NADPH)
MRASELFADFSLGLAWKERGDLDRVAPLIPPATRIHVGFRDSGDTLKRVAVVRAVWRSGFVPVPVIAARRLESEESLRQYLAALANKTDSVLVVGGDPALPRGPYPDAASVIGSGLLEEHGITRVSVAGHPGGHPAVADDVLWPALLGKTGLIKERELAGGVVTQFGFDAAQVLAWIASARERGIDIPVRIGVPGPATAPKLRAYADQCGVTVTSRAARAYGLTETADTVSPGRFLRVLASGYDPGLHGAVTLHFNTFAGIAATAKWIVASRVPPARGAGDPASPLTTSGRRGQ